MCIRDRYKIEKCVNTVQTLSVKKKNHIKDIPLKTVVDIIYEPINKVACNKSIIGGIRETDVKEFTQLTSTDARTTKYKHETFKLNSIDDYDITDGYGYWYVLLTGQMNKKGTAILGPPGHGKSYKMKEIKKYLQPHQYRVAAPTHKAALNVDGETIYSLFNINVHNHTYLKSTVDKLKSDGVEYILIDEISMINSKVWSILRDIKKIYGFIFILVGDFYQLPSIEDKRYNVINSELLADLADGQVLEMLIDWRAKDDIQVAQFSEEKDRLRNGEKPKIELYGNKECRRSICWTNKMRKVINERWNMEESKTRPYIIINNIKVYKDLPLVCKKTFTNEGQELKNNELFTVINFDSKTIEMQSKRFTTIIKHESFKHFQIGYCITTHCSQSDTFDFEYSIYEYRYMEESMIYTAITRAKKLCNVNLVDKYYPMSKGYIYSIKDSNGKQYIGSTTNYTNRWEQHIKGDVDSPLHREMQLKGADEFTFEIIEEVEYVDPDQLLMRESILIMQHDTINNGYNCKFSIDFNNIY